MFPSASLASSGGLKNKFNNIGLIWHFSQETFSLCPHLEGLKLELVPQRLVFVLEWLSCGSDVASQEAHTCRLAAEMGRTGFLSH